ncbi:MAG: sigma-70 family RNA polymerase sigma factor [Planctomycetes bacterium]|nr:sigma-70 family RNA polymerase sigma factor [Planctomycetota bacterium]
MLYDPPIDSTSSTQGPDGDTDLMLRCGGGDRAAFEELLKRYETRLLAFIRSIVRDRGDAEDLFQETFLRVHRAAPRYVPKARLSTFLHTIARNLALNFVQKKREKPVQPVVEPATAEEAGRGVDLDALRTTLAAALSALPPNQREAITLRYVSELPYKRIAEVMGAPMGTVASWVHEGLKTLSPSMRKFGPMAGEEER